MNCIKMFFKKRRLIKKYTRTDKQMMADIHLSRMMKDDKEFMDFFRHNIYCELRALRRIKQL